MPGSEADPPQKSSIVEMATNPKRFPLDPTHPALLTRFRPPQGRGMILNTLKWLLIPHSIPGSLRQAAGDETT